MYYGLVFLLGSAFALAFHFSYLIPLLVCLWFYRDRLISGILVCLLGFCWAHFSYTLPKLPEEGVESTGIFIPDSISYSSSPFQRSQVIKGTLKTFGSWKNIPCRIYAPKNKKRPKSSTYLQVEGKLLQKDHHLYVLKLSQVENIPKTFSLAEWRFQIKNQIRFHLEKRIAGSQNRAFLLSMLTGEIDDRLLAMEFNRLGILHLLGISGFQFALLAFLFGALLRRFFSFKLSNIVLMILLSAYTFILGDSPPIERAWIGSMLYLSAQIFGLRISALNALGLALLWQLIKEPLLIFHLGFQFSFLCTAAILMTYPLFRSYLSRFFPRRSFSEASRLSLFDQHGHLLSFFCRESLALNGAIHLVTLPLILFHFHKFPLLSLAYNLFLPALVSGIYVLLVLGWVIPGMHFLTEKLSGFVVKIATHPPALYDFQLRVHDFPMTIAVITITILLVGSVYLTQVSDGAPGRDLKSP